MKISLDWKEQFNTNIEEIDYQHKYFLKLIKRFALLTEEENDNEYLNRILNEISRYAVFHFCSEENLMYKHNYPLLKQHQRIHQDLIAELDNHIINTKHDPQGIINLIAFLANWFMQHTVEEDKKLAQFIMKKF